MTCPNHHHHHWKKILSSSTRRRLSAGLLLRLFLLTFTTTGVASATEAALFDIDAWQSGNQDAERSTSISLEHACFEEYWQDLPSLIKTTPNNDDNDNNKVILQIEGFSFLGRMAIYEFLMFGMDEASLWSSDDDDDDDGSDDHHHSSSTLREHHWLWAYASQMDWQHRSGRLNLHRMMTADTGDRLSIESWWSYMNFCFSVAILLGAEKSGVLQKQEENAVFAGKEIVLQMDPASQVFVEQDVGVQASIHAWADLFRNGYATYKTNVTSMMSGSGSGNTTTNSRTTARNRRRQRQDERFRLQQQVWKAHTAVIHNCTKSTRFNALLEKMPPAEQKFGMGWASMVEILATGCFPTDLVSLLQDGAGFLPLQVLDDYTWSSLQDNAEQLEGLEKRRYMSIVATHDLVDMPISKKRNIESFWKRISRNYRISRSLPSTIQKLYHGSPLVKFSQLIRLFGLFVRPREWIAVGAGLVGALLVRFIA